MTPVKSRLGTFKKQLSLYQPWANYTIQAPYGLFLNNGGYQRVQLSISVSPRLKSNFVKLEIRLLEQDLKLQLSTETCDLEGAAKNHMSEISPDEKIKHLFACLFFL